MQMCCQHILAIPAFAILMMIVCLETLFNLRKIQLPKKTNKQKETGLC